MEDTKYSPKVKRSRRSYTKSPNDGRKKRRRSNASSEYSDRSGKKKRHSDSDSRSYTPYSHDYSSRSSSESRSRSRTKTPKKKHYKRSRRSRSYSKEYSSSRSRSKSYSKKHKERRFKDSRERSKKETWKNKVYIVGEIMKENSFHFCDSCLKPIYVYCRLIPCKHVFCDKCGLQYQDKKCPRCDKKVTLLEHCSHGSIFMCYKGGSAHSSHGCRRTYLSQRDLDSHINHRHLKKPIPPAPNQQSQLTSTTGAVQHAPNPAPVQPSVISSGGIGGITVSAVQAAVNQAAVGTNNQGMTNMNQTPNQNMNPTNFMQTILNTIGRGNQQSVPGQQNMPGISTSVSGSNLGNNPAFSGIPPGVTGISPFSSMLQNVTSQQQNTMVHNFLKQGGSMSMGGGTGGLQSMSQIHPPQQQTQPGITHPTSIAGSINSNSNTNNPNASNHAALMAAVANNPSLLLAASGAAGANRVGPGSQPSSGVPFVNTLTSLIQSFTQQQSNQNQQQPQYGGSRTQQQHRN